MLRVLDCQALVGGDAQAARGLFEDVGSGFAVRHFLRRDDDADAGKKSDGLEQDAEHSGRGARGDRDREPSRSHEIEEAPHFRIQGRLLARDLEVDGVLAQDELLRRGRERESAPDVHHHVPVASPDVAPLLFLAEEDPVLGEQAPIGLVVVILGVQERTVEIEDHRADRVSRLGADPGGELDDVSLRVADLRLAESVAGVARRLQLHQRKIEGRDAGKFGVHVVHHERQVTRRR